MATTRSKAKIRGGADAPAGAEDQPETQQTKITDFTAEAEQEQDASPPAKGRKRAAASSKKKSSGRGKKAKRESDARAEEGEEPIEDPDADDEGVDDKQQDQGAQEGGEEAAASAPQPPAAGAVQLPDNAIEQGAVTFLFKPKVTTPGSLRDVTVSDLSDVQRMYLLLEPHSPPGGKCRLMVVGKKRLPDTSKHERFFAFIEAVGSTPDELTSGMGDHTYTTATRGERLQPGARTAGQGTYVIAKGGGSGGVHLGFKLSTASEVGEVQDMLNIKQEGSFVLSAKNPDNKGPGAPSAGPNPDYTPQQRQEFGGRSWIGVEDRSLLDVAGTELLMVGAKDDPIESGELGEAGKLLEQAA